jgi:hypothetical protein
LDVRNLDLLDWCPEARALERVAPLTAAVSGRFTAEWLQDRVECCLKGVIKEATVVHDRQSAAFTSEAMDLS